MKRSDPVRSVFESTAYELRHVMETVKEAGAKAKILRICGDGAKSRTWCQIKASMLKMPVYILDEKSGDVPDATYLVWLDCRELGMDNEELRHFMIQDAKIGLNEGYN